MREDLLTVRLLAQPAHYVDVSGAKRGGRPLAMLAYLLVQAPEGAPRDELIDILWDAVPGADMHHRLRSLLHDTSNYILSGVLQTDGALVRLDRARVRCDLDELRDALAEGDIDAALSLYEADVLTGCFPAGASQFIEWAGDVREHIRLLVRNALAASVRSEGELEPEVYVRAAQRLVALDEWDAFALEHLLRGYLITDRRGPALEAAQRLEAIFSREGRRAPAGVRRLTEQARVRPSRPSEGIGSLAEPAFVGRVPELRIVRGELARLLAEGTGGCIGVGGATGIGKTAFLGEVERLCAVEGIRVVRVRAYEVESHTPYSVLTMLLAQVDETVTAGPTPQATGLHGPETVRWHMAVAEFLVDVAARSPLVILVDDVHWADPQSRECLHRIALAASGTPLMLVLAYRDALARLVNPLLASVGARVLRLQPLDLAEISALLESMARFPDAALRDRLVRLLMAVTGGVPFQIQQQLRWLFEAKLAGTADGVWVVPALVEESGAGRAAEPALALIARRLRQLQDTERAVLAATAVIGRTTSSAEITRVAGFGEERISEAIDVLLDHRLLTPEAGGVSVAHAEIAHAARRAVPRHRIEEMFHTALREAELSGMETSPLRLLQLSCGAGLRPEARCWLLAVLAAPSRERETDAAGCAEEMTDFVREWSSPDLASHLEREISQFCANPAAAERAARRARSALKFRRELKRRIPVGLAIAVGLAGVVIGTVMRGGTVGRQPPPLFGGGGVLLVSGADQRVRALRIAGPMFRDTVPLNTDLGNVMVWLGEHVSPDGSLVLFGCEPPGGGAPDVCMRSVTGSDIRRLAPAPGDDHPAGWSPDGRHILMSTDRFSGPSYSYDVAVVDLETGDVRALLRDALQNTDAVWSPDGSRIAFRTSAGVDDSLHVFAFDGTHVLSATPGGAVGELAWSPDGRQIAFVRSEDDTGREAWLLEASSGRLGPRFAGPGRLGRPVWSPDGRVLLVTERLLEASDPLLHVFHRFDSRLETHELGVEIRLLAWLPDRPHAHLDRVTVDAGPGVLHAGETLRLAVSAYDSRDAAAELHLLTIESSDPETVAWMGGDTIAALAPGRATVVVSAGGWRRASIEIEVRPPLRPSVALREDWSGGLDTARWLAFGEPLPGIVDTGAPGRAMRNNGDATYPSGLVTRRTFTLDRGLAVEWHQRTPLTEEFWQEIWLDVIDTPLDSIHPGPGEPYRPSEYAASTRTPLMSRQPPTPLFFLLCSGDWDIERSYDEVFTRTDWHHVVLQLYPSSGCDLFVDGNVVARVRPRGVARWPPSVRVAIGGRSHSTDMLVGEFRVHEGMLMRAGGRRR